MALPMHTLTTCGETHLPASKSDPAPAARNIALPGLLFTQYHLLYEIIWIVRQMGSRGNKNQG